MKITALYSCLHRTPKGCTQTNRRPLAFHSLDFWPKKRRIIKKFSSYIHNWDPPQCFKSAMNRPAVAPQRAPRSRGVTLTDHGRLDETPSVALRQVGLQDPRWAAGFVHTPEHVDLPAAHGGRRRVHRLGQRGHRLPLVGDGVVPAHRKITTTSRI